MTTPELADIVFSYVMTSRRPNGPSSFDIPDLELPAPRRASSGSLPKAAPAISEAKVAKATPNVRELDADAEHSAADIALDLDAPISRGNVPTGFGGAQIDLGFDLEPVVARPVRGAAPKVGTPKAALDIWPKGVTPEREQLTLDPTEIRQLAGFGDPPSLLGSPLYAVRVLLRQGSLTSELRQAEQQLTAAEQARDDALVRFAEQVRPALERDEELRRWLSPLLELERESAQQGTALVNSKAELARQMDQLHGEHTAIVSDLKSDESTLKELEQRHAEQGQRVARSEAKHKRCFIEIRALEQAPAGGAANQAQIQSLTEQAQNIATELAEQRGVLETLQSELDNRKAAMKARTNDLNDLARSRARAEQDLKKPVAEREASLSETAARRRDALLKVARSVLAAPGSVDVDAQTLAELTRADEQVLAHSKRSEMHLRALDAGDRERVRQGIWLLGLMAAAIIGFFAYQSLT